MSSYVGWTPELWALWTLGIYRPAFDFQDGELLFDTLRDLGHQTRGDRSSLAAWVFGQHGETSVASRVERGERGAVRRDLPGLVPGERATSIYQWQLAVGPVESAAPEKADDERSMEDCWVRRASEPEEPWRDHDEERCHARHYEVGGRWWCARTDEQHLLYAPGHEWGWVQRDDGGWSWLPRGEEYER